MQELSSIMRTTKEINAEIDSLIDQIRKLNGKKAELTRELIVSAEAEFETQMNVKRGDPIKTESGTKFFYDGFVYSYVSLYLRCHPAKKDGTASKSIRHLWPRDFGFEI